MKVRLGRKMWNIDREMIPGREGLDGLVHEKSRTIYIRRGMSLEDLFETVIHEGLHAQHLDWSERHVTVAAKQLTRLLIAVMS